MKLSRTQRALLSFAHAALEAAESRGLIPKPSPAPREAEKLLAENAALRADFERYSKHAKMCPGEESIEGCQCGLWLARRRWAGEKK